MAVRAQRNGPANAYILGGSYSVFNPSGGQLSWSSMGVEVTNGNPFTSPAACTLNGVAVNFVPSGQTVTCTYGPVQLPLASPPVGSVTPVWTLSNGAVERGTGTAYNLASE
jgi:hypothetical protein